jgi:hypothetical protein
MSRFTNVVSIIHIIVFWLSVLGCIYFVRNKIVSNRFAAGGRGAKLPGMKLNEFFYSAMVFLFINAAICATLAGVYERYQARVAWLIPLCLGFYACERFRQRGEWAGETAASHS